MATSTVEESSIEFSAVFSYAEDYKLVVYLTDLYGLKSEFLVQRSPRLRPLVLETVAYQFIKDRYMDELKVKYRKI